MCRSKETAVFLPYLPMAIHYFLSIFIHFTDKQIIFEGEQNITLVARILPVANLTGFSCLYGSGLIVTVGG